MSAVTEDRELRVGIVGCGFLGGKRAAALSGDRLVATHDLDSARSDELAGRFDARSCSSLGELLDQDLDVAIIATTHDQLSRLACSALEGGCHVLVEKPVGIGASDVDRVAQAADDAGRLVRAGFNHRFHPGIARAITEARSGLFGPVMFMRARYGHGGRLGYEQEWRANSELSGGGELVDQGMHLLDLSYWLHGALPLHSSLLRTNYWDMEVEDNAVLVLGETEPRDAPWSLLHVSWTEWKNMFSLEIYCRTAKFALEGLAGSYGPQHLSIFKMKPELGPPDVEQIDYPEGDRSWELEWLDFRAAVLEGAHAADLGSSRYAWECIERAYETVSR